MSNLEEAEAKFSRADHLLKYGVVTLVAFIVLMFAFVSFQLYNVQNNIAKNQEINAKASQERFRKYTEDNAKQHAITQAYIKCIANALLVPVSEREPSVFDDCGVQAKKDVEKSGGSEDTSFLAPKNSSTSQPLQPQTSQPAVTNPQPTQPSPQLPVATAPPDPDSPLLVLTTPLLPLDLSLGGILRVGN